MVLRNIGIYLKVHSALQPSKFNMDTVERVEMKQYVYNSQIVQWFYPNKITTALFVNTLRPSAHDATKPREPKLHIKAKT
jgi:hypothetical protein